MGAEEREAETEWIEKKARETHFDLRHIKASETIRGMILISQ